MFNLLENHAMIYGIIAVCVLFNFISLPDGVSGIVKKALGVLSMILAVYATYSFISVGMGKMGAANATNIVITQWMILILIFTPVMVGLFIHGYYGVKGYYDKQGI